MADPGPIVEPEARDTGQRTRWPVVVLALLAALIVSQLAPAPWPDEDARIVARYLGQLAIDEPVGFDGAPTEFIGAADGVAIALSFADGLTPGEQVHGELRVTRDEQAFQPALGDLDLELVLADGRHERIPAVRWDAETGALVVARRPPVDTGIVLGLLTLVVLLWVSEAAPLFVTALAVPVILVVAGVQPADDALAPFFHPIIALFFGGFLMAEAMRRVGLDRLAAINLVARFGRTPATLFAAMIGASAFLSMWMSNTAAAAVLVPIALAVTEPFEGSGGGPGYRRALVLGIAYAATIGGVGSAIGTPANPLAIEFLDQFVGRQISFIEWFAFGLPLVALFLPLMGAYLWWRLGARVEATRFAAARVIARGQLIEAGRPGRDQLAVLAIFVGVMAVWLTQTWHGTNTGIVALGGAVALALLRYVRQEDLARISWPSLITFGGGLALGVALVESGTADWVAAQLGGLADVPAFVAVLVVALLALGLTTVASNTASAAMLVPMAIPLAGVLGLDPVLLVVTVAVASSIDFALVIGTPPTMIAYSTRLFSAPEIFRVGAILDATGVLLLVTVVVAFWRLAGLV